MRGGAYRSERRRETRQTLAVLALCNAAQASLHYCSMCMGCCQYTHIVTQVLQKGSSVCHALSGVATCCGVGVTVVCKRTFLHPTFFLPRVSPGPCLGSWCPSLMCH